GDALHDFGGIVAGADDRVGADFSGVLQHKGEGVGTGLLAEVGEQRDVSADQRLQAGADGAEDGTGADDNPAHHAEGAHHAVPVQFEGGGDHIGANHLSRNYLRVHSVLLLG